MTTKPLPHLATQRLILRPFEPADGPTVERLAGAREVADTTLNIPHPYPAGGGTDWILTLADAWESDRGLTLAVCLGADGDTLVGAIGIRLSRMHSRGELGYWIASGHWGQGYATEAAQAVLTYAFTSLALHRVQARHFTRNPASGRVMQKLGMQFEGIQREAYWRWDAFEDVAMYSVLAPEWTPGPPLATGTS